MSVWDNIVGQQPVVARLQKIIEQPQTLAQSWLFVGPPGSGRSVLAAHEVDYWILAENRAQQLAGQRHSYGSLISRRSY